MTKARQLADLISSGSIETAEITSLDAAKLTGNIADARVPASAVTQHANNYTHPNHSGEVTSTADGATVITDNIVDEANLKISNTPTNGYVLSAQSGNTGGLTWAEAGSGGFTRVGGGSAVGQNLGTLSFDNFSSTYNLYYVQYRINFVADGSQLLMRVRNSSGFKTNAGYFYATEGSAQTGTHSSSTTAEGGTSVRLSGGTTSNDGHHSCVGHIMFYKPHSSSHVTAFTLSNQEVDENYRVTSRHGGGEHQVAETHVGFGFTGNTQNIEQYDVQIYGLNES